MIKAIQAIYHNSRSVALLDDYISEELHMTTDVLKADTLPHFIFILVMNYVMKKCRIKPRKRQT